MKEKIKIFSGVVVVSVIAVYLILYFIAEEPTEWGNVQSRLSMGEEVFLEELKQAFGEPSGFGYGTPGQLGGLANY